MKYLLITALFITTLVGCGPKENNEKFVVDMSQLEVKFTSVSGGALMEYTLPKSDDILSINVRYTDANGVEVMRTASYLSNELELIGFNQAASNIEAKITLGNRDHVESEPISATFSTLKSGTVAFFDDIIVASHWNGFLVKYNGLPGVRGIAAVSYWGSNPITGDPELILLEEFPIAEGENIKYYELERGGRFNDVVITTQDNRGYVAMSKTFYDKESLQSRKLASTEFSFYSNKPEKIFELEYYEVGQKFLFDSDTKGLESMKKGDDMKYHTFIAGPYAFANESDPNDAQSVHFIIDLKKSIQPASLRLHAMLDVRSFTWLDNDDNDAKLTRIWGDMYQTLLPCHVKIFGTNDISTPLQDWVELAEVTQLADLELGYRWAYMSAENGSDAYKISNETELEAAEECYLPLEFDAIRGEGEPVEFRYLRLEVYETFDFFSQYHGFDDRNLAQYFTLNELEIFVKEE